MYFMDENNDGLLDPIAMETAYAYYEQERIALEKEEAEEAEREKDREFARNLEEMQ